MVRFLNGWDFWDLNSKQVKFCYSYVSINQMFVIQIPTVPKFNLPNAHLLKLLFETVLPGSLKN